LRFLSLFFGLWKEPAPTQPSTFSPLISNQPVIGAALELERRLYESAVGAVEQTFAKEGLVITFLTSGAIVALGSCLQAYANVASRLGSVCLVLGTVLFSLAVSCLAVSFMMLAAILKGHKVEDLPDGQKFLAAMTDPAVRSISATADEVLLQLIGEYRTARVNHENLVSHRMSKLRPPLRWLGTSVLASVIAVFVGFISVAGGKDVQELESRPYVIIGMRPNTSQPIIKTTTPILQGTAKKKK
jgi:hypothetical protein